MDMKTNIIEGILNKRRMIMLHPTIVILRCLPKTKQRDFTIFILR